MPKPSKPAKRRNTALAAHLIHRTGRAGSHANPIKRAREIPRKRKHKAKL